MSPPTHLHAISLVLAVVAVLSDIQPGYLDFDNLPETNFSCEGKVIGGYYADVETGCQMFHVCTIGQKGEVSDIKFLCLNGTVFDQETRVCERIDEVDCEKSEDFFNLNLELYGNTANFSPQECVEDECEEEEEDAEYDDDTESTTVLTTTTVKTTTTSKPTTQRTTVRTTQQTQRTPGYTRYTTSQPDSISALLALHNAFNQGLNRRPILSPIPPTRLPSITSTTTRRPNVGYTLRTRFGTPEHQRHDHFAFRPRPTFQPTFTSSVQTPFKSNYHTFESTDTRFVHSFDPENNFQFFAQKSSPSPFTVRLEPQVQVVTSTSTSTSIKVANTTVDDFPYDYDGFEQFFHDVPKITRPKRSTTRSSSSRYIKSFSRLNSESDSIKASDRGQNPSKNVNTDIKNEQHRNPVTKEYDSYKTTSPKDVEKITSVKEVQNFESKRTSPLPTPHGFSHKVSSTSPEPATEVLINDKKQSSVKPQGFSLKIESTPADNTQSSSDHVIKIDPSDVLLAKNYTGEESTERKEEYLNNLLDTIALENTDKNRVLKLLRKSEPEMEQLITSKGVDMMLETLENKLLEMELEGGGTGVAFEYEGDSREIREKRGSDNKSSVGGNEENINRENDDELNCTNPEFCVEMTNNDDVVKVEIEGRRKRSTNRVRTRVRPDQSKKRDALDEDLSQSSTEATVKTTKKSRRKVTRTRIASHKNVADSEPNKNWDSSRKIVKEVPTTTKEPDVKPVTEEIEGDVTTAEYRRPPPNNKWRRHYYTEVTTPYSIRSSTRLQTRFDYENQNAYVTTLQTTAKPSQYRHVPVYELDEDYTDYVEIKKSTKKQHKVNKRAAIIVEDEFYKRPERTAYSDENEEINLDSIPIQRTRPRAQTGQSRNPIPQNPVESVNYNLKSSDAQRSNPRGRGRASGRINKSSSNFRNYDIPSTNRDIQSNTNVRHRQDEVAQPIPNRPRTRQRTRSRVSGGQNEGIAETKRLQNDDNYKLVPNEGSSRGHTRGRNSHRIQHQSSTPSPRVHQVVGVSQNANVYGSNTETTESTLNYHREVKQENVELKQSHLGIGLIDEERFMSQENTDRRKVVKIRNQYTDRSVLPEEISYATLRPQVFTTRVPDHDRKSGTNTFKSSANIGQEDTDSVSDLERSAAPTVPPTPYTPGPGIEADPNFSCRGLVKGGLYADVHADCHGFFICSQARRGIVGTHFWCGVGTRFNQKTRTCQTASLVDCSIAPRFFHLNDNTYIPSLDLEDKLRGSFEPMREH